MLSTSGWTENLLIKFVDPSFNGRMQLTVGDDRSQASPRKVIASKEIRCHVVALRMVGRSLP